MAIEKDVCQAFREATATLVPGRDGNLAGFVQITAPNISRSSRNDGRAGRVGACILILNLKRRQYFRKVLHIDGIHFEDDVAALVDITELARAEVKFVRRHPRIWKDSRDGHTSHTLREATGFTELSRNYKRPGPIDKPDFFAGHDDSFSFGEAGRILELKRNYNFPGWINVTPLVLQIPDSG